MRTAHYHRASASACMAFELHTIPKHIHMHCSRNVHTLKVNLRIAVTIHMQVFMVPSGDDYARSYNYTCTKRALKYTLDKVST